MSQRSEDRRQRADYSCACSLSASSLCSRSYLTPSKPTGPQSSGPQRGGLLALLGSACYQLHAALTLGASPSWWIPWSQVLRTDPSLNHLQLPWWVWHLFLSGNLPDTSNHWKYIISNPNFPVKKLKLRRINWLAEDHWVPNREIEDEQWISCFLSLL